ncbi:MAG TPA: hypothetical protein VK646_03180 [Actinomycetota bacterium]|nr:hypothetical protein [Actinomycetota bacterium]
MGYSPQPTRWAFITLAGAAALLAAVFASVCVALLGPSDVISCKSSGSLDRVGVKLTQVLGGGSVSTSSPICVVPSATAWEFASIALIFVFAVGVMLMRRSMRRSTASTEYWTR